MSLKADLENFSDVLANYISSTATDICSKFFENDVIINFDDSEILYSSNEVILKFQLGESITLAEFQRCVKKIPKMLNFSYSEYIKIISSKRLVGIKLPLPEYMKKMTSEQNI